jgi:hypothetical protein
MIDVDKEEIKKYIEDDIISAYLWAYSLKVEQVFTSERCSYNPMTKQLKIVGPNGKGAMTLNIPVNR